MAHTLVQHAGRKAYRWVPEDGEAIQEANGLGVVYVYTFAATGKVGAVAYKGNAAKASWHYSYKDRAGAERAAAEFFAGLAAHRELRAKWRAESYQPHNLKPGDIVYNSWGYDQTNIDWYRVTRVTAHYAWLKPIAAKVEETSFMAGPSMPRIDVSSADPAEWGFSDIESEPETKHRAYSNRHGDFITFKHGAGCKWDGKPKNCSWYA